MIYLILTSTDSRRYHQKNNTYDFTVELRDVLQGQFTCALLDFSCQSMSEDLYVFSDICEPQYIHDSDLPLLRIITEPGEVTIPHFKRVSRQLIQRVRIYIRNGSFDVPTDDIGPIRVTLALEPI